MELKTVVFSFFGAHICLSIAMIFLRRAVPDWLQYIAMPGIIFLRPMARLAGRFRLDGSFPLALVCGGICLLLGSVLWTVAFIYALKLI